MPSTKVHPLIPDFLEETVAIRGIEYHFRELSIGDYDEFERTATTKTQNPLTGEEDERIDNALLLKLMVLRCSFDPKLTPETLASMPMRATLKINQTVNRMHYGDEPEPKKDDHAVEQGDAEPGNA